MASERVDLLTLSLDELTQLITRWGQPRFRAAQIWRWLYHTLVSDPEQMLNLPKELRSRLQAETTLSQLRPLRREEDEEGLSEKVLFQTADGQVIESVLMRYAERNSVCVSSQIGCPLGCVFCATGQRGYVRDLTPGEICAQILYFARSLAERGARLTHVVFMGMGEPLLNADAVLKVIANLNQREGMAFGVRRFTLSTAGVVPGIERLARESLEVGLAVSLHAADNALRNRLVPLNRRYPLERLIPAVKQYIEHSGRRVTFEYVLAQGVNDAEEHARRLVGLLRGLLCHVNLIPLNPTPSCEYTPSTPERVARFLDLLRQGRLPATLRLPRGIDIQAGCGQLRGQFLDTIAEE